MTQKQYIVKKYVVDLFFARIEKTINEKIYVQEAKISITGDNLGSGAILNFFKSEKSLPEPRVIVVRNGELSGEFYMPYSEFEYYMNLVQNKSQITLLLDTEDITKCSIRNSYEF